MASVRKAVAPHPLHGSISVPGDKSITHRALLFGSIAQGQSKVRTSLMGRDNLATLRIMRQLGVHIHGTLTERMLQLAEEEEVTGFTLASGELCEVLVEGQGFAGLRAPTAVLDCGNSGTTSRLLTGVLSACPFSATLTGDESLVKRPFRRVTEPLSEMGAKFSGDLLPFTITGGSLVGISYISPKASAQVKSAVLLAGLEASGPVAVCEPWLSRDHTERMLTAMGCEVTTKQRQNGAWQVSLPDGPRTLSPLDITIPGDFSAAAFFLVAATVIPGSRITIRGVGMNATRDGLYRLLLRMGARIELTERRTSGGEVVADLVVQAAPLHGIEVGAEDVVIAIDEIPILAIAAACAQGSTIIRGAEELRVKESDRLTLTAGILKSFGVQVDELPDGLHVHGSPQTIGSGNTAEAGASWANSGDHRIAMCAAILQYICTNEFEVGSKDQKAVETSFPSFNKCLRDLSTHAG